MFSTSNYDTSLAALNSKLASSAPRGSLCQSFQQPQIMLSSQINSSQADEKNVFAIYVNYYVKVKLTLSGMGGEVSLKLPFILGNIEVEDNQIDKSILPNHSNDLHLNDHQILDDIKRPNFNRNESEQNENTQDLPSISRNSSVNCKSLDYDDDIIDIVNEMSINNEGINFINQKFCEMNRRNSNHSSDSSTSDADEKSIANKQEVNIQAQVHSQKYLESDI